MSITSFIITGKREAGKSTLCWFMQEYLKKKNFSVGGVITLQNEKKWFYLVREFRKIPFEANNKESFVPIGRFKIHKTNLELVIKNIKRDLDCNFLFIDEIGFLELQKGGYYPVLRDVISREQSNFLVVKQVILDDFIEKYPEVRHYNIITVHKRELSGQLKIIKHFINNFQN